MKISKAWKCKSEFCGTVTGLTQQGFHQLSYTSIEYVNNVNTEQVRTRTTHVTYSAIKVTKLCSKFFNDGLIENVGYSDSDFTWWFTVSNM